MVFLWSFDCFVEINGEMYFESYPVEPTTDLKRHEFYSEGPMGRIKKVVLFQQVTPDFYNLALKNEEKESGSYVATRNNNNDLDKVLITVANTVIDFMLRYPTAMVMAAGDLVVQNRLYQMKINKYLINISAMFTILGYYNNEWEYFHSRKNYNAFLVKAKENN